MDTKLMKQKILDLAIRGKLVPQDPNDEPVSVLLEKIRKEKQELIKQGKIKKDKNESTIFVGDDKQHYEKFVDGTVKNIENEIPFDIPETWSWCRFSQLFELRNGFTPLRSNKLFWENGTMPWFTIEDKHRQGDFIKYTSQHITEYSYKIERIVPKNSVLLCCTASIGEVAFNKIPLITNQQFNGISVKSVYKNTISPMYLYYYCQTLKQYLIEIAGATTFGFVSLSKIEKILLPFPCFSEQQRIVDKIEALFAQVDKIEEEKLELLKLIDKAKEKVLDLAMKGKLVKQDPNDEPASVLLEKIFEEKKKLAKEGKIKLSKDELLAPQISDDNDYYEKLPQNWSKTSLKNITNIIAGQSPNGKNLNKIGIEFHQGKLCFSEKYLTTSNVQTNSPTKVIDKNSIVICVRAPVGDVNITQNKICIGRGLAGISTYNHIDLDFLFYYLKSCKSYFELNGTGSTFKSISSDCIKNLEVFLPPENEQKIISKAINKINEYLTMIKAEL